MLLFFIVWFWNFFNNELMRFEFDKFEYMTFFRFAMSKSITFFNRVMRCNLSNDDNVDENDNDRFFEFSFKTEWKIFFFEFFLFFLSSRLKSWKLFRLLCYCWTMNWISVSLMWQLFVFIVSNDFENEKWKQIFVVKK